MKIFNRTKIPICTLRQILKKASEGIKGVRISNVVIKVNTGRYGYSRGHANRCNLVRVKSKYHITDGGCITVALPTLKRDFIQCAINFFDTAKHEWGHIKDYQENNKDFSKRINGKRPKWKERPEEIRAENYCYEAEKRGKTKEDAYLEIMGLALALEEFYK